MSTEPTVPSRSTEPPGSAKRRLSGTGIWVVIGGLLLVGLTVAVGLLLTGVIPRSSSAPAERTITPPPSVSDRAPTPAVPAERPKAYTQEEVNVIKDLTRVEERSKIALEQQYGAK